MPASHETTEHKDYDADGLAVIDVLNRVLKTVEDEFSFEGTSKDVPAEEGVAFDAEASVSARLAQSTEENSGVSLLYWMMPFFLVANKILLNH